MATVLTVRAMSDEVRQHLPTGDYLVQALTVISNGMAADALLDTFLPEPGTVNLAAATAEPSTADPLPSVGTIVALPQFAKVQVDGASQVDLVQWEGRSVVVVPEGEDARLSWKVEDSSLPTLTGTLEVAGGWDIISGDTPPTLSSIQVRAYPYSTPALAKAILRRLSKEGREKAFEATHDLTAFVTEAVSSASMRVFHELHDLKQGSQAQHVLDESEREAVVDQILYGSQGDSEDQPGEASVTLRLLRRVAATDMTRLKSVVGVIGVNLWSSAAETHVRRFIGDPHLGRVIRRLAREIGSSDPDAVLDAYREKNPTKAIGIDRITSALSAGATIHAQAFTLRDDDSQA